MRQWLWLGLALGVGCDASAPKSEGPVGDTDLVGDSAGDTSEPDVSQCPELGRSCNPIPISAFPYSDDRDTTSPAQAELDAYSCAPSTDESGGEFFYQLTLSAPGVLTASVDDRDGTDVDVHLLSGLEADSCLSRANRQLAWVLQPGTYYLVVDSWTAGSGESKAGAYTLQVDLVSLSGKCAMTSEDLRMFWSSCAPGVDCRSSGGDVLLHTPSVGPVVKEAHLVTPSDSFGAGGWPTSFWDGVDAHYALSQAATGFSAARDQPWAPDGEGNSHFGQGATGAKVPVLDEAWYVNMYWRDRPTPGTRMIVLNPFNGRAVVASAGYETGPGSNEAIGGAVEEIHLQLGTVHRDLAVMGFAADQSLPLGPISCP